jgi:fluoride ion exporter CrcB/FEX
LSTDITFATLSVNTLGSFSIKFTANADMYVTSVSYARNCIHGK